MDWLLYDRDFCHEKVNKGFQWKIVYPLQLLCFELISAVRIQQSNVLSNSTM